MIISAEDCKDMGGHCWDHDTSIPVPAIYPPPETVHLRCRHCGKTATRRVVIEADW
jgi:hypothetical protein